MHRENNAPGQPNVDKKRLLNRLITLCGIYGPSCKEKEVSQYILNFVQKRIPDGLLCTVFSPETIPSGGDTADILIRVPGKGKGDTILLSAHLDTVPLDPDKERKVILSDGIIKTEEASVLGGDDRAGVAAALEMIDIGLAFPEKHAGLEILFTVQEEQGCRGSRDLDASLFTAKYGYNLDGETPPGSIIIRAPQKSKYEIEIYGKSSHAALAPQEGLNAIKIAARIIEKLPQGKIDPDTTSNIGSISGGRQTNIIPDFVKIKGEVRSFSEQAFNHTCKNVEQACNNSIQDNDSRVVISWEHSYNGYAVDHGGNSVRRFTDACRAYGIKPRLLSSPGGGDSNNINALGIENVVFGLGMHEIHTANEYLVLDEFYRAVDILYKVVFK